MEDTLLPAEDRYLFDLQGFLILRGVLSADEVAELNRIADERMRPIDPDVPMTGLSPILEWDDAYRRLMDHPTVLPYLSEWVDPALRLDSAYGIHTVAGTPQLDLHLGGTPYRRVAYYHHRDGHPFLGLTVVSWALTDVPPGEHGFVCIPGSHKSMEPCPADIMRLERDPGVLHQVPVQAGDAIIFTEALTHGSYPWTLPFHRRVLFYRYTPGHMVFDPPAWSPELLEAATDRQRQMMEPGFSRWVHPDDPPGTKPRPRRPVELDTPTN